MSDFRIYQESRFGYLLEELDHVRNLLRFHADPDSASLPTPEITPLPTAALPTPLDRLTTTFGLSSFDQMLVLLGVGLEIDPAIPALCGQVMRIEGRAYPSIGLACQLLNDFPIQSLDLNFPIHRWQLVKMDRTYFSLQAPITLSAWTLQYLLGFNYTDPLFSGSLKPQKLDLNRACIPTTYQDFGETVLSLWSELTALPVTQLIGQESEALQLVATILYHFCDYSPYLIRGHDLVIKVEDISDWMTYWQRQALLDRLALVIDCGDPATLPPPAKQLIRELIRSTPTPVMLIGAARFSSDQEVITYDLPLLEAEDKKMLWSYHLGRLAAPMQGQIGSLVSQFDLSVDAIQAIATQVQAQVNTQVKSKLSVSFTEINEWVWELCRAEFQASLAGLAERIQPHTTWEELILPPETHQMLQQIIAAIELQATVYDQWQVGGNTHRGVGITALFSGPSDTGKTTAAEIIAHDLKLDLYRVNLAQVIHKEMDETQRNLKKVFDAVQTLGGVLLFEAADARYPAPAVGYLLQRMEQYSGLAILATHSANPLAPALMQRIQLSVQFSYPTPEQRVQIWQDCFPAAMPTHNLSYPHLSQLEISGASIRNIAMASSLLASKDEEPIQMKHLLRAAQAEREKLGRSLTDQETCGWI
jgi:ATP-dependent 26S proteasome regulatory subunit